MPPASQRPRRRSSHVLQVDSERQGDIWGAGSRHRALEAQRQEGRVFSLRTLILIRNVPFVCPVGRTPASVLHRTTSQALTRAVMTFVSPCWALQPGPGPHGRALPSPRRLPTLECPSVPTGLWHPSELPQVFSCFECTGFLGPGRPGPTRSSLCGHGYRECRFVAAIHDVVGMRPSMESSS